MNRIGILVTLVVLMSSVVFAGSIDGLDYKDRVFIFDTNREINDNDVNIDADTVNGMNVADEFVTVRTSINNFKPKGEPGLGKNDLSLMLIGSGYLFENYDFYTQYILEMIEQRNEQINLRMDYLEASIIFPGMKGLDLRLKTALITAKRTGTTVFVEGFRCRYYGTVGDCIRLG